MRLATALAVTLGLYAGPLFAQSLGDVAKKERERRQKNSETGKSAKSYSNTDDVVTDGPPTELGLEQDGNTDEISATGSVMDEERERAKELEPRMAEIARMADNVDRLFKRYKNTCENRYAVGRSPGLTANVDVTKGYDIHAGRDWFVVLERPPSVAGMTTQSRPGEIHFLAPPECQALAKELVAAATGVRRAMEEFLETARRERILPGMVRELRRKYRLDWSGWG